MKLIKLDEGSYKMDIIQLYGQAKSYLVNYKKRRDSMISAKKFTHYSRRSYRALKHYYAGLYQPQRKTPVVWFDPNGNGLT
jgi:hypothetical protein